MKIYISLHSTLETTGYIIGDQFSQINLNLIDFNLFYFVNPGVSMV